MQKLNTLVGTFYILNLKLYSIPISIYSLMHVYIFLSFLYLKLVKKKPFSIIDQISTVSII